jgi:hypothetical protein
MIKLRIGILLLALLLIAAPSPSQASDTLHLISAKRTAKKHVYKFGGYFNYNGDVDSGGDRKSMSRVGFYDDVTYYPSSGLAVQTMTMDGEYKDTVISDWGCTDDPWLNPNAKCTQERYKAFFSYSMYLYQYCPGGEHGHWCLAGLGLVPKNIVPWMRRGPPTPKTSGPAHATDQDHVRLTANYAKGAANRVWVQQWYCPPGKDGPPTNTPSDITPFGGACKSTVVSKPLKTSPSSTHTSFKMAYPHAKPKAGTWYVRTRLGSDNYGNGVWGDWHKTVVAAVHLERGRPHVSLNPETKIKGFPAPRIMAPREGQVLHGNIEYGISLARHAPYSDWSCCSIQWKRAVVVTKENNAYAKPGQTAFPTPPTPWQGPGLGHTARENSPIFDGGFPYAQLTPRSHTFGYRYWFRVREKYLPNQHEGPWSAWRSFIVQKPVPPRTINRSGMQMRPGAHMAKPSTGKQHNGQQQNSRKLVPMAPMHFR